MAYSLNDLYYGLRLVMRANGLLIGLLLGGAILIFPRATLSAAGVAPDAALWPGRMAGALLVALGLNLLIAAQERIVSSASMVSMAVANALAAIVLLLAYLNQEFSGLDRLGQIGLVLIFLLCLVSAVVPLRYLRTDYVVL
ncbi:MAG: hypothetical protein DCC57_08315 [Chloroflexi bacterium]|nr:MAG: hypothetical protein DCC57_08315 [Chloroflexota bacterium]